MSAENNKKYCVHCGQEVPEYIVYCPKCGGKIPNTEETKEIEPKVTEPRKKNKKLPFVIGGAVVAVAAVVVTIILLTSGCKHDWKAATCLKASYCTECGEVKGEPAGHIWEDATCTEGKVCKVCGAESGDALEHNFSEWETVKAATCEAAGEKQRTCKRCNEVETEELSTVGHTKGDWEISEEATVNAEGKKVKKCTECDEVLETESYELTSYCDNGSFVFTVTDFTDLLKANLKEYGENFTVETLETEDGSIGCAVEYNNKLMGVMAFGGTKYADRSTSKVSKISFAISYDVSDLTVAVNDVMGSVVKSCDPALTKTTANDITDEVVDELVANGKNNGSYEGVVIKNGVKYMLTMEDEWYQLTITVD